MRHTRSYFALSICIVTAILLALAGCSPESILTNTLTTSSQAASPEVALAKHLNQKKAKMYGAYWCPACQQQKQYFGEEAFSQINYIECDPAGKNSKTELCRKANIKAFPTWEINGKLYPPNVYWLEELAELSGYKGDRNFRKY